MIIAGLFSIIMPWGARLHWGVLWFLRLIVGFAHGVIWPCMAVIMSHWAPPDERGKLVGFMNAGRLNSMKTIEYTFICFFLLIRCSNW
jgi:predicted MFS family arabinose efflux permease